MRFAFLTVENFTTTAAGSAVAMHGPDCIRCADRKCCRICAHTAPLATGVVVDCEADEWSETSVKTRCLASADASNAVAWSTTSAAAVVTAAFVIVVVCATATGGGSITLAFVPAGEEEAAPAYEEDAFNSCRLNSRSTCTSSRSSCCCRSRSCAVEGWCALWARFRGCFAFGAAAAAAELDFDSDADAEAAADEVAT